ncbi:MAG TPA: radical SAM family heme chaperone HemW [Opitutaceae bacterium]|nr:radical SAM family heme chaperone HemW [Opitutaceae bacterium]
MSDFATAQAKAISAESLGLYVHVPFCARKCDFCAFYQTQPTAEMVRGFLSDIEREAAMVGALRPAETIFWGGGTPGLLAAKDLTALGQRVLQLAGGTPAEWSVEMTPTTVTEARLAALRELGVTRISMGVQSFRANWLDALGRHHTREQIYQAYERLRAAGFKSVNLDMMFALPGQTDEEWLADVREAVSLAPDHLSTYCLTFEEDTKLWLKLSQGKVRRDVESEARLYTTTWETLAEAGYAQYEISNFARPGHACLHNLNTWRMQEWVGLGPSAASQYAGQRGTNIDDLARWHDNLDAGRRATEDRMTLTPALLAEDALIFGLRMNEGVDLAPWRVRAPEAPWAHVEAMLARLAENDLVLLDGTRVRLSARGRLVADAVGSEVMDAFSA